MGKLLEWPDKLPGRIWVPGERDFSRQRKPPKGIVIHSGDIGPGLLVASLRMGISYHFVNSVSHNCLVQIVSLQDRAWHGGSLGNDDIGIAISGPDEQLIRSPHEKADFRLLVLQLQNAFNWSLERYKCHSDYDENKSDPGPGFDPTWVEGFNLQLRY